MAPGIAGQMPSLSIQYSSHGGNGVLGQGFSLSGLYEDLKSLVGKMDRNQALRALVRYSIQLTNRDPIRR